MLCLQPLLPTKKHPIRLYSNQNHDDLKRMFIHTIKSAKHSITLQMYGLTDPDILRLLENKILEGCKVKIFYDKSGSGKLSEALSAIPIKSAGLMHRKILVIDGKKIFLGTANFTTASLKMHGNVAIGFRNKKLANFFERSTEEECLEEIGQTNIQSYLLPSQKGLEALCATLNEAKKSIQIAMFTLTHPKLLECLKNAKKRGVEVAICIDQYTAEGASKGAIAELKNAGIRVYKNRGKELLHHKWAIIDHKTLALGSANWTQGAFERNQDSLIILKNCKQNLKTLWRSVAIGCEKG